MHSFCLLTSMQLILRPNCHKVISIIFLAKRGIRYMQAKGVANPLNISFFVLKYRLKYHNVWASP